jgi:plastocyanin
MAMFCGTRLAKVAFPSATCVTVAVVGVILSAAAQSASAATLELHVRDRDGRGVPDVVVVAAATEPARSAPSPATKPAVMDQHDRRFVPQVLVVQTGTPVSFPNNDTVSHQVYSFSPARRFQLPLYKGEAHSPVAFDTAGLVVLGCNIHDEMVGYIYVADSPYFARTDADGNAEIDDVPAGSYRLDAWGPRVADSGETLVRKVTLERQATVVAEWNLQRPLRPHPSPGPRDVDWDY